MSPVTSLIHCRWLRALDHFLPSRLVIIFPANDDGENLLCIADLLERVRFEQYEIGDLSLLDGAERVRHPEKLRRSSCGALQRLHRRHSDSLDKKFQFFMSAPSRVN